MRWVSLLAAFAAIAGVACDADEPELPCCWQKVSLGWDVACGLRTSGRIECWGAETPIAEAEALDPEHRHSSWQADGSFVRIHQLDAPDGEFVDLSTFADSCAVSVGGGLECWGDPSLHVLLPPNWPTEGWGSPDPSPDVPWTAVSTLFDGGCALNVAGEVECFWAAPDEGTEAVPCSLTGPAFRSRSAGPFARIRQGGRSACGQRLDGLWTCWGFDEWGGGGFIPSAACLEDLDLSRDELLRRIGPVAWVIGTRARDLEFKRGINSTIALCLLDEDGAPHCPSGPGPGTEPGGLPQTPKVTRFADGYIDVAVGRAHACFLHESGAVDCIGDNRYGQRNAPDISFASIWAGDDVTCGITDRGGLTCWGDNSHGQLRVPDGP